MSTARTNGLNDICITLGAYTIALTMLASGGRQIVTAITVLHVADWRQSQPWLGRRPRQYPWRISPDSQTTTMARQFSTKWSASFCPSIWTMGA